jgi:hypothetical protein
MRDWRAYVRENLGSLQIDQSVAEEVAGELAGHLEERYEALRTQGLPEEEAFLRTRAEAGNWKDLRRGVISAKREGTMSDRVRQIWVPSLATLSASVAAMALFIWTGIPPISWHLGKARGVELYLPWLLLLPFIGAAGGYMCRRSQGAKWQIYLVGAFPALAIAAIFGLTFPIVALYVDPKVVPGCDLASLAAMTVSWVILPGILLCIGVALQGLWNEQASKRANQEPV